jgi:hypothetical protein
VKRCIAINSAAGFRCPEKLSRSKASERYCLCAEHARSAVLCLLADEIPEDLRKDLCRRKWDHRSEISKEVEV